MIPEIRDGESAVWRDYHVVHTSDGRAAVHIPSDRGNDTVVVWWGDGPAVFDTSEEARAVIEQLWAGRRRSGRTSAE